MKNMKTKNERKPTALALDWNEIALSGRFFRCAAGFFSSAGARDRVIAVAKEWDH